MSGRGWTPCAKEGPGRYASDPGWEEAAPTMTDFAAYLRTRGCGSPRFSPDGARLAFVTTTTGTPEVWSVPAAGGWPSQLTFAGQRVWGLHPSPGPDVLVVERDRDGDERCQLIAVTGSGGERPLTALPQVIHRFGAWSPDGRRLAFTANREHPTNFTVYVQDLDRDPVAVWRGAGQHAVADYSPDGRRLLISHSHSLGDQDLHVLDLDTGESRHINPHHGPARYGAAAFLGEDVLCASDEGREFSGILRLAPDGARTWLLTPDHDVEALAPAPDRTHFCYAVNEGGYSHLRLHDPRTGADRPLPGLPPGVLTGRPHWSPDGGRLAVALTRPTRPEAVWVVDLQRGGATEVAPPTLAGLDPATFVDPELVEYPSFDGRRIPALYYRPRGASGRLPVVVAVHGGPEGQARPSFDAVFQYLLARGFAVLAPNVRGSTGYGHTYEHLDDGRRRMDAVRDLAACAAWLGDQGGADPRRIALYGHSYGGFMVLAGITHHPELWAAAVDVVGIADLETFLEHTHPTRRSLREAEYGSLAHDRDFFREISPIHHVDRIRAPLLVIHGQNDPRVPHGEAEQIVGALRVRDRPVEFLSFADEGHGLARLENRLAAFPAIAAFLERHLTG